MHKPPIVLLLTIAVFVLTCCSGGSKHVAEQNPKVAPTSDSKNTSTIQGRVVRVHDGDTITVRDSNNVDYRIRLAGIDAPELDQAFGTASGTELANTVLNKEVIIQYQKLDRYDRLVGKVLLDGQDMCLEQIEKGMAWHFKRYEGEQVTEERLAYADAEQAARNRRMGLWTDSLPTPPWEFRASSRTQKGSEDQTTGQPQSKRNDESPNLGPVVGNKRSMVYHREDCPDHEKVSLQNRVYFKSPSDAERAGYRVAGNCPR
jgi:endonuclease YncB( thermonuclease family)